MKCARTWRHIHEATLGQPGDVRRCDHGRIWIWKDRSQSYQFDHWEGPSRLWTPIQYWRARAAIKSAEENTDG